MRQYVVLMCLAFAAVEAVVPGYNYKQPPLPPVHPQQAVQQTAQAIRQTYSRPQAPAAIYSPVQAPPLATFSAQQHIQQNQQQQNFVAQQQQQTFVPQQQQQQVQQVQQTYQQSAQAVQQQGYVVPQPIQQLPIPQGPAPQQIAVPAPIASIPQSHQQQVIQQQIPDRQVFADQLSLPIPAPQPVQQQTFQQQNFQQQTFQRPQTAIITKDIYIHSAPEDNEEQQLDESLDNAPIRKNYRIVFIKAPSQNLKLASAALKRAQAVNEEKTVIYVLSKKPDFSQVQQQLIQSQGEQKTHKPEVYFIKYKTQEEAQRAQQEIQAQYDALGGSTHISDEGIAPLTTAGALNLGGNTGSTGYSQQSFQTSSTSSGSAVNFGTGLSQKYLPSKTLK